MTQSPGNVSESQLEELSISLVETIDDDSKNLIYY